MAGVPIYLVSACTTGEEFVAAFRRYADRGSLFVPIAEPLPSGRRGRFAVTLSGGGVMIEGDAEIISSAKTPSILHGRIGMTIRFGELDDSSKTMLIELEKARLVAKPPAPAGTPRQADVPAAPRPKVPTISGRIDASTALAECVAIGDLETLAASDKSPPKAGPKFVMPAVLPVGSPRPKTPSTPPELRARTPSTPPLLPPLAATAMPAAGRPKTPSIPPAMPALGKLPASKSGPTAIPTSAIVNPGSGPTAVRAPIDPDNEPLPGTGSPAQIMAAVTAQQTPTEMAAVNVTSEMPTVTPVIVPTRAPRSALAGETIRGTAPSAAPVVPTKASRDDQTTPTPIRVAAAARREDPTPAKGARVTPPAIPTQRRPTPPPMPALKPQEHKIIISDLDENTDVTNMPSDEGIGRKTAIGVAVSPGGMVLPAMIADPEEAKPTELVPAQLAPISNKMPTVEEATPSGDWTITPGADGPTIEPRKADETPVVQQDIPLPKVGPTRRQTGDWTIQLDSDSPDGWTEPAKVVLPPVIVEVQRRPNQAENPPELAPVARSIDVEPQRAPVTPVVAREEPKIQVDPTLLEAPIVDLSKVDPPIETRPRLPTPVPMPPVAIEARPRIPTPVPGMPAMSMPMSADLPMGVEIAPELVERPRLPTPIPGSISHQMIAQGPPADVSMPVGTPDPRIATPVPGALRMPTPLPEMPMPTPIPGSMLTPVPGSMSAAQLAAMSPAARRDLTDGGTGFFRDSGEIVNLSSSFATVDPARGRRKRIIVIAVSAGLVLAIGIALLMTLGGDKKTEELAVPPPPPVDAQASVVQAIDAAEVAPPIDAAVVAPPPVACTVEVTSVPPGVDVIDEANTVLGQTPATLPLPCAKEVRLTLKKLRFANTTRPVTPTAEGAKLRVLMQKLMFSIKVSSQPAGASISLNGKSVAVTPSVMKVPAFDQSTITFSKDGYLVESVKVSPKQNNQTVHMQLKKKPRTR